MTGVEVIALDGDGTLWHSETVFGDTRARFRDLLAALGVPVLGSLRDLPALVDALGD